ncbi:hypothetical protein VPH5P1C_0226 [Vibrio phage 5P1c]
MKNIECDETVNDIVKQIISKQELLDALPKSVFGDTGSYEIMNVKRTLSNEVRSLQELLMERCKELTKEIISE